MSLRTVGFDDPSISLPGALEVRKLPVGVTPRRLPAWTAPRLSDPSMRMMVRIPSGVRLAFRSNCSEIELVVLETALQTLGRPRGLVPFDLLIDGQRVARKYATVGNTVEIDPNAPPPGATVIPGDPSTIRFEDLGFADKSIEIWLPQSATLDLHALRITEGASLMPLMQPTKIWAHYGSSISHGMEADGPSETWPAQAARAAGVNLMSMGFAGQCQLDGYVARSLRDGDFDLISLKLGINVINGDTMRERVFWPTVESFLDVIREGKPQVPILIVSPIICPVAESRPGPTIMDGSAVRTVDRPKALRGGVLTLIKVRAILAEIVSRRRAAGDLNLHYLDGLELFGARDVGDLPDGLHPNADGLRRMGDRFARLAFGAAGPFRA